MTLRNLQKWHGAGNDFLVEVRDYGRASWWNADRVRAVCDRWTGVGADGVILATAGAEGGADATMVLYNADGSRAEMSGNGLRCCAAALHRATRATWSSIDVVTDAGLRHVELDLTGDAGWGSCEMGPVVVSEGPSGSLARADVGNPHVVVRDEPDWSDAERVDLARALSDAVGGANVEFATVLAPDRVRIVVVERGVGWTRACGTGSCATAAVLFERGEVGSTVTVENPGGDLRVSRGGEGTVLAGPVQFVANVEWLSA